MVNVMRANLYLAMLFPSAVGHAQNAENPQQEFELIKSIIRDSVCEGDTYLNAKTTLADALEQDRIDRVDFDETVSTRDIERRTVVAGLSAQGCIKDGDDHFAAAVIYQHGMIPRHYLEAALHAKEAVRLGHSQGRAMLRVATDRYLMSLGRGQVFASQITAPVAYKRRESVEDEVPCLWPQARDVEFGSLPDTFTGDNALRLEAEIAAKMTALVSCDFPAKPSDPLIRAIVELKL